MSVTAIENNICNRTEERTPVIGNIFYSHSLVNDRQLFHEGVTANISVSGVCIYTLGKIEENIEVVVHGKVVGDIKRNAIVRWCEKVNNEIFRVGLAFSRSNI